ncbi:MAG TPA: PLP-dependent aspartate aminotransferase family protein [Geminicoccus sp.]|uniref:trans-sulfuration enzyme family protein n=1 Tax=Geminicoccus sp. TaxID=2024832 RepID=UPI002C01BBFC|nr:PLP-dependent aspartate aminotransferase family protein [Geminicoccus sp.]HWL68006.1 PLP-dependent aspartate aminotransferase family protein [Geminicoccus sp.]
MTDFRPETLLAQAAGIEDPATGGLIPPLQPSTTFLRDPDNAYRRGFDYARDRNPTYQPAEAVLAGLEGGAEALLFSSGMAAATAVFQALRPGDHVLAPQVMYWGLRKWLLETASAWGLAVELVDTTETQAVRAALRPGRTRLLWLETPANPTWAVSDIAALAELAHRAGALVAVDNTVPTPLLTRPLELGADLVMHSATKYLNGHSDVVAGALVTRHADAEIWSRIRTIRHDQGAILGPFEAWLLTRGLRTLHLRLRAACGNAMHLAARLQEHTLVERVLYPGLPTHKGHTLAARQMQGGFGGMLSILVRGGEQAAIATAANVRLWKRATSLGGVESLLEHRASIEGQSSPAPANLLRLSAGVEDVADLIADLESALAAAGT